MISSAAKIKSVRNEFASFMFGFFFWKGIDRLHCGLHFFLSHGRTDQSSKTAIVPSRTPMVRSSASVTRPLSLCFGFFMGKKRVLCMTRRQTRNCKQGFFKTKTETGTYTSSPSFVGNVAGRKNCIPQIAI